MTNPTFRYDDVLTAANNCARGMNHAYVGTEHLLAGLILENSGYAAKFFKSRGVTLEAVAQQTKLFAPYGLEPHEAKNLPTTPRYDRVLQNATAEAIAMHVNYVGTEHILLALLDDPQSVAYKVLVNLNFDPQQLRHLIWKELGYEQAPNLPAIAELAAASRSAR